MNTICIFTSLMVITAFALILSILYTPIENFKAYAAHLYHDAGGCVGNISGKWNGNDGGTYWIWQSGSTGPPYYRSTVTWFGASSLQEGTGFSNVFKGIKETDASDKSVGWKISGKWVDVPMGKIMQQGEISFTCVQEGGIDKLKRTSQTGGFGGSELTKLNHLQFTYPRIQSGSCEMLPQLRFFPDGHVEWRAHAWSEDEDDAWVIQSLVLLDKSGKVLHGFPKFSKGPLPIAEKGWTPSPGALYNSPNWKNGDFSFPASIFNSIASANFRYSC